MANHPNNGEDYAFEVKEKAPAIYIFSIQASLSHKIQIVATINLRPACEAWENGIGSVFITFIYQISLLTDDRTRTDKAHVAFENVDELWEFVNGTFAKESLKSAHLRIVVGTLASRKRFVCSNWKGAELPYTKWTAVQSRALLKEKYRSPIVALDQKSDDKGRNKQKHYSGKRRNNVKGAFKKKYVHV